jgi:predicted O-methyltransferase YrrM
MYGPADASVLRSMLLDRRPQRVVEIGSGYSTAVTLDVAEEALPDLEITCVEPYADRLRSRLRAGDRDRLTLVERPVQEVEPARLVEGLEPNDIFFIDSTHVVKAGSDVAHLFLHTLPLVPPGVVVHVHDIFWPFEYPDEWLRLGRDWTESYLLQAFLAFNGAWEVLLFNSWLWAEHPELAAPGTEAEHPGSIWLRRIG